MCLVERKDVGEEHRMSFLLVSYIFALLISRLPEISLKTRTLGTHAVKSRQMCQSLQHGALFRDSDTGETHLFLSPLTEKLSVFILEIIYLFIFYYFLIKAIAPVIIPSRS